MKPFPDYVCDICGEEISVDSTQIAFNRGDGAGPHAFCKNCVTDKEAWAMFQDFEKTVIAGEPDPKN